MADPYIGEIRMNGFDYAPRSWALCNGQEMPIDQYNTLYALLGTTFGGDGVREFRLPDLRGRTPIGPFGYRRRGYPGGYEGVVLNEQTMPSHSHKVQAMSTAPTTGNPIKTDGDNVSFFSKCTKDNRPYNSSTENPVAFHPDCVGTSGGTTPHTNMQPYLAISFCIALEGLFPSRN